MADHSNIEWTEATWNPIVGCSILSPGCTNCYAMKMAARIEKMHPATHYAGTTKPSKAGPVWTGKLALAPDRIITQPLRWKKPRTIFVNSMGDLFHDDVLDEWIDRVFAVMALSPQHTFQVLTKRSARMRAYVNKVITGDRNIIDEAVAIRKSVIAALVVNQSFDGFAGGPLPNVWLGVSAERQQEADERIPDLLATPAAIRFVSAEPLLGPIDFTRLKPTDPTQYWGGFPNCDALRGAFYIDGHRPEEEARDPQFTLLDWIIVGGESGNGARPMHPDWARSIRDQCAAADVPFFFKQWGEWQPTSAVDTYSNGPNKNRRNFPNSRGVSMLADGRVCLRDFTVAEHQRRIREKTAFSTRAVEVDQCALDDFNLSVEDPDRLTDNPLGYQWMYCVGKHRAGRLLDGIEHNGMPAPREVRFQ